MIRLRRGGHGGARVMAPEVSVAARYAGLLLQIQGTTINDVYEARSPARVASGLRAIGSPGQDPAWLLCRLEASAVRNAELLTRLCDGQVVAVLRGELDTTGAEPAARYRRTLRRAAVRGIRAGIRSWSTRRLGARIGRRG